MTGAAVFCGSLSPALQFSSPGKEGNSFSGDPRAFTLSNARREGYSCHIRCCTPGSYGSIRNRYARHGNTELIQTSSIRKLVWKNRYECDRFAIRSSSEEYPVASDITTTRTLDANKESGSSQSESSTNTDTHPSHYEEVSVSQDGDDGLRAASTHPASLTLPNSLGAAPVELVAPPSDLFHVVKTSRDSKFEIDYLGESTKGDMKMSQSAIKTFDNEGAQPISERPIEEVAKEEAQDASALMRELNIPVGFPHGQASRGIFCSRTLNLRSITTIGYDMDYTLIHYNVNAWEGRAYDYAKANLKAKGFPVDGLTFDPDLVIRGLIMDKEKGNLVKADRFGYVKRAIHGTTMLTNRTISNMYGRELVDLRNEHRWEFLNTLFSVSEAVMYMQMVDRLDQGMIAPEEVGPGDYHDLYKVVARALFRAHVEGQLKAEIVNEPDRYVELDPELPITLLDQKEAGKRLLLITNSDYDYTRRMMSHSFDRFLPEGMTWRNLFDMVIVSARKPDFFQMEHPLYEIVTADGLMRPCFKAVPGGLYCGGSAQMVERALGFSGDETMYVGDHIYTDVSVSKVHLRWRTVLILRELEREVDALCEGKGHRERLIELMDQKEAVGDVFNQLRLALQRRSAAHPAQTKAAAEMSEKELTDSMQRLLLLMERLDREIAPMLETDGKEFNTRWGYLSRAGLWDKSHLTRQIEKYADIYTSRVSNFLRYTPFMYFRSQSQSLAHDHDAFWATIDEVSSGSEDESGDDFFLSQTNGKCGESN